MATSPNYAWAEPDNSSLVKNGAADIRILGDAIDTSVWNVGYGQAGKNKVINGNFGIWQRGTTFSNPSVLAYTADRWQVQHDGTGATRTISQQAFTAGSAPVAGYEGQYFYRYAVTVAGTGNTYQDFRTNIEDVRTFAGQTVTLSFWAKADSARTVGLLYRTEYGSGGSAANQFSVGTVTLTTSWVRYSVTYAVPSLSGLTIGAGSYSGWIFRPVAATAQTIDIWGVQLEYGSKATPFQTASGGSPQAELAMCQRYYYRLTSDSTGDRLGWGGCNGTTDASVLTQFPVQMRTSPTALEQSGTAGDYSVAETGGSVVTCSAVPTFQGSTVASASTILTVASGLVGTRVAFARATNSTAYLGWSAEL